ncbi:MAG: hypothetical protein JW895_10275 [Thermoleophilaceae bacterium]|nr:hypothetical protein [Thermoleophilaceae bacterium]
MAALLAQAEAQATDGAIRQVFGVEPVQDLSGLFTGVPSVPNDGKGEVASSDPEMDLWMAMHFPQAVR